MIRIFSLIFFISSFFPGYGQKQDFEWIVNYDFLKFNRDSGSGCTKISFNSASGNPDIYFDSVNIIEFYRSSSCISDIDGNFLFAFNGYHAEDATGDRVLYWENIKDDSEPMPQGHLILPVPNKPDEFYLFTTNLKYIGGEGVIGVIELSRSILKIKNGKRVEVLSGKKQLIADTLDVGKISACKHANGRDWWIIVPLNRINHFYNILLTPNGIDTIFLQKVNDLYRAADAGFSCFSSNGEYYVIGSNMAFNHLDGIGNYIDFFHFDRCDGRIFNHQYKYVDTLQPYGVGVEFSPDNKFLYVASGNSLYQYEIVNGELTTKRNVANHDGFLTEYLPGKFAYNNFHQLQLAPDGRIYVGNYATYSKEFNAINRPNNPYNKCEFRQHHISIPTIKTVMPSFPKYRLGPIDNSVCDTLNIDNIPLAYWRYDQDTANYLRFEFTDLSTYEAEEWIWDFGDPSSHLNSSTEQNPYHLFTSNGSYEVCLIAKNIHGSDTFCRIINIGTVSTDVLIQDKVRINLFPNPFNEYLIVDVQDYNPESMEFKLHDQFGKNILSQKLYLGRNFIEMKIMIPGIFYYTLSEKGINLKSNTILKISNSD